MAPGNGARLAGLVPPFRRVPHPAKTWREKGNFCRAKRFCFAGIVGGRHSANLWAGTIISLRAISSPGFWHRRVLVSAKVVGGNENFVPRQFFAGTPTSPGVSLGELEIFWSQLPTPSCAYKYHTSTPAYSLIPAYPAQTQDIRVP